MFRRAERSGAGDGFADPKHVIPQRISAAKVNAGCQ